MNTLSKCVSALLIGAIGVSMSISAPAFAKKELESLKEALTVQLKTPISGIDAAEGQPFEAILTEDYRFDGATLSAGTQFSGSLVSVKPSRHLARPGYVVMDITEATLPNGQRVALESAAERNRPIHHEDANNMKRVILQGLPFFLINAATTVPIRIASTTPGMPIGFASKMILGVAREYYRDDKDKDRPDSHKVGYGLLVGTGLPGIMFTASKQAEPELKAGDNVDIFLDPDGLQALFDANN